MAPPHVIVLPLPVQSHINPLTCLADYLASSGLLVTLIHSSSSFSLLQHTPPIASLNPRIHVLPDGLPAVDSFPPSPVLIFGSLPLIKEGLDHLLHQLLLEQLSPPSCIIADNCLPWTRDLALKYGIPRIEYWPMSAATYSMCMQVPEMVAKGYLPIQTGSEDKVIDFIPGLAPFPLSSFPKFSSLADITGPEFQFFVSLFAYAKGGDRILVNSFYDLESSVMDALRALQVRIDPIGPLVASVLREPTETSSPASLLLEDRTCLDWLDTQEDCSVLYIAFGSLHALEKTEIRELALGLEASQEPFLWVIRPDPVKGNLADLLPEKFQSRMEGRSRIISWAPQLDVLTHRAVGAFLTHCGWNSTMEGLYAGVPMIGFPQALDQNTNLQSMIIDWKVGMALEEKTDDGRKCSREAVERAVKSMMRGEEGERARSRAREFKEIGRKAILDGSSRATLESLVNDLKQGR